MNTNLIFIMVESKGTCPCDTRLLIQAEQTCTKKPIWGKPVLGQFPGYIQPQPLSSHRRGLRYPTVCIHYTLLIQSCISGRLGCFLKHNFIKRFKTVAILDGNLFKSSCVPALLYEKEVGYGEEISRPLGFDLRIRSLV